MLPAMKASRVCKETTSELQARPVRPPPSSWRVMFSWPLSSCALSKVKVWDDRLRSIHCQFELTYRNVSA